MSDSDPSFYVGYEDRAAPGIARFLKTRILLLLFAMPVMLGGIAFAQKGFIPSVFEFGVEREFVGWLSMEPVPALVSLRPGNTAHCGAISRYPLVSFGKFGADAQVASYADQLVRLRGTLVHVDDQTMIELASEGVELAESGSVPRPASEVESLGLHRFEGEIVDSKCYYGVMNPGSGKVHRGCAARCISGGVPPSFLVRDEDGGRVTMLLVDSEGRSLGSRVLDRVGRPVSVAGEVLRYDDLLVLKADPSAIERLSR